MLADLDKTDRKILAELDWDARQSDAQIAKKLKISRSVANYRIKRLQEQEFITGYYTVIDASTLGYYTAAIKLDLLNSSVSEEAALEDFLIKHQQVFYLVDGDYDASFGVWVQDLYALEAFMQELKVRFRHIILKEHVSLFTRVLQYPRSYLLKKPSTRELTSFGKAQPATIDDLDKQILSKIAQDARVPTVTLSQELNTPAQTIAYRLKQLENKGVIQHYRANINFSKYQYQYFKVDIELNDLSVLSQLKEFATQHPNILYHEETVAGADFEFDVELASKQELLALIKELKTKYSAIRRWKYYAIFSYKKIKYCPAL